MAEPLKLGTERSWGETTCGYGLTEAECSKPAAWHLLWLAENFMSNTCDEHLAFIDSKPHPEYERHTFAGNCGMPGTLWHHPYEDEPEGYCLFPAVDDLSVLAEADEPVLAGTTDTEGSKP